MLLWEAMLHARAQLWFSVSLQREGQAPPPPPSHCQLMLSFFFNTASFFSSLIVCLATLKDCWSRMLTCSLLSLLQPQSHSFHFYTFWVNWKNVYEIISDKTHLALCVWMVPLFVAVHMNCLYFFTKVSIQLCLHVFPFYELSWA